MKRVLRLLGIFLLAILSLAIIMPLSPILLPLTLLAYWFFSRKKPNERFQKYAKNGVLASVAGFVFLIYIVNTDEPESDVAGVESVETVAEVESKDTAEEDDAKEAETEEERAEREQAREEEDERRRQKFAEYKEAEEKREKEEEREKEEKRKEREKEKELAEANPNKSEETEAPKEPAQVPEGQEDVPVNDNIPRFSNEDITSTAVYHNNGPLDSLGRVTAANAVVGVEIMPAHERGNPDFEPTGWNQRRYAGIGSGGWLYNRSHLIGFQLTGNDDYANLMTGTRWFNMRMLEYENFVANYVETTENHVRYRVTPVFEGNNLVASGAYMEGFSIEDNGEGLMFNIYIPNVQPGVEINYADGSSVGPEGPAQEGEIKPYTPPAPKPEPKPAPQPQPKPEPKPEPAPAPTQPQAGDISGIDTNGNGTVTIQEAEDAGFSMPITSDHWLYPYMIDRDGDGMVGE